MRNTGRKSVNSSARTLAGAFVLMLCVLVSGTLACVRMGAYAYEKKSMTDIPLKAAVEQSDAPAADNNVGAEPENSGSTPANDRHFTSKPGFEVNDDNTVWGTDTEIELFHVSYRNGDRIVTVNSEDGDKLVAPGTENEYTFRLVNTGNVAMDYRMETTATLADGEDTFEIPLTVKFYDRTGRYLAGSETQWAEFTALNNLSDTGVVGVNRYTFYTIDWQWPFESGDDVFDTMLGDTAVDRDLVLTVTIKITARQDENPAADGGIPQMGDDYGDLILPVAIALISVISLAILLISGAVSRKSEQNNDGEEKNKKEKGR